MHKSDDPERVTIPIELRLLAACCEHPATAAAEGRVRSVAAEIVDWNRLWDFARRHQVQGFVQDRLKDCDAVPLEVRGRWLQDARARALFNLRQARETGRLHKLLHNNSIPNLVIKGLPLAAQTYGSLTIKRSSDIDLLIRSDQAWRTVELLAREGFVAFDSGRAMTRHQTEAVARRFKEITLRNEHGIVIDLHWHLVSNRAVLTGLDPFERSRSILLENIGEIAVLSDQDQFAYLCVHGALSDWSRFKWLADVNAVLGERSDQEIVQLYLHAEPLGAGPSVLQALALRELFWNKVMPPRLAEAFEKLGDSKLLSYPVARMSQPYRPAGPRDTLRRILSETGLRETLYGSRSAAVRDLGTHLVALPDVLAVPLPAPLNWLYVPLRPFFWAARKLRR